MVFQPEKKQVPDLDDAMNISHTTIYSTIRALPKAELKKDLLSCLRHENKRRKAKGELKKDSAESVRLALTEAMRYLSEELRKTLTYDRGREISEHKILEQDLGIEIYFCDPHSPWQK